MYTNQEIKSDQIEHFLIRTIPPQLNTFLGCFPRDLIPWDNLNNHNHNICSLIANTDTSDKPGTHFIVILRIAKTLILWDSFGSNMHYSCFLVQARNLCAKEDLTLYVNINQFQSITSKACGYFCIWLILSTCYYLPMTFEEVNTIQCRLSTHDLMYNERFISCQIEFLSQKLFISKYIFQLQVLQLQ